MSDACPVAVIGTACRFPGAPDSAAYWRLLREGREGLRRLDRAELLAAGTPLDLLSHPDHVPVAGVIDGQELFDPAAFGFSEADAALLDPQQRLFLESAWLALDDAGRATDRGRDVGVFAGSIASSYLVSNLGDRWDPTGGGRDPLGSLQVAMSTQPDYLPLQTAHRLDLRGPAVSVAASCATSLVAVHLAAQSLAAGECDTALAGGVSLIVPQGQGYRYVPGGIFSRDGRVAAYAADGTGIVYSQGVGCVVLRRLDDALADGDRVLAVLAGSAVTNDGAEKTGFTAPSVSGQMATIAQALAVSGIAADGIGLIEGHGTGTALGDPIEVEALHRVHGDGPDCGLGSVKSTIGHTNAAAGIASFIKAVLAIHHRILPATLHCDTPNPDLGLSRTRFRPVRHSREWDTPPAAAVSSFGIGGTNAHVILTPAPTSAVRPTSGPRGPVLLPVSAPSAAAARRTADAVTHSLWNGGDPADTASTLVHGRATFDHRISVVHGGDEPSRVLAGGRADLDRPRLLWVLPGGGSQRAAMAATGHRTHPVFAEAIDETIAALADAGCAGVADLLLGADAERNRAAAEDPIIGLPALFAVEVATGRLLASWGIVPDVVIGHSLGEYAAVVLAGVPVQAAAPAVATRCRALKELGGGGLMLSVRMDPERLAAELGQHPGCTIAVHNAPLSLVVTGPADGIRALHRRLAALPDSHELGARILRLATGAHSALVDPALPHLRRAAQHISDAGVTPTVTVLSSTDGAVLDAAHIADPDRWARQLRAPVRFDLAVDRALGSGDQPFIVQQVGPGTGLAALVREQYPQRVRAAIGGWEREADTEFLAAAGALWAHGVTVDLTALTPAGRRVSVPSHPFDRIRCWVEPPDFAAGPGAASRGATSLIQVPVWREDATPPWSADDSAASLAGWHRIDLTADLAAALPVGGSAPFTPAGVMVSLPAGHGLDVRTALERMRRMARFLHDARTGRDRLPFLLVTAGAHRVLPTDPVDPVAAAIAVLPRVIAQESPGITWRVVDLGVGDTDGALVADEVLVSDEAAALARPQTENDGGELVALRGDTRWLATFDSVPADSHALRDASTTPDPGSASAPGAPPLPRPHPRPQRSAVILGGLGDVGMLLADRLADNGFAVVLTSRTYPQSPGTTRAASLQTLQTRHSGLVEVVRADVTDAGQVASALDLAAERAPLQLVIQAASVVGSAALTPLRDSQDEHVDGHLASKVLGTEVLAGVIDERDAGTRPRQVVLMSSLGTLVGGIGAGPYVAVNGFLDGFARSRTGDRTGTRWTSVVWDAWRVGPLGTELPVHLEHTLGADDGDEAVRFLLQHPARRLPPVIAVSTSDLATRVPASGRRPPVERQTPSKHADSRPLTATEAHVAALWSRSLGRRITDPDADFFALGGHSLLGLRILTALRETFGTEIGMRDLLDAPTVAGLAALLPASPVLDHADPPTTAAQPEPAARQHISSDRSAELIPMTRVQHAYWVGRSGQEHLGDVPCHFAFEFDCPELDLPRYEAAWRRVLQRHPMLRVVVGADGDFRELTDLPPYRIRLHDATVRGRSGEDAVQARLRAVRRRVFTGSTATDRWPLLRIEAVRIPAAPGTTEPSKTMGGSTTRVFVGVDALVCDAGSYRIIDAELAALYRDPSVELDAPADVRDVLAAHRAARQSPGFAADVQWWRQRIAALPAAPDLSPQRAPQPAARQPDAQQPDTGTGFARYETALGIADTDLLFALARDAAVTPTALLLTCYLQALADWSGRGDLSVMLTLFDRPDPSVIAGVDTVVGDFTSLLVHEAHLVTDTGTVENAIRVQRRLFTDLDHRACTALDVPGMPSVPVVFTSALGLDSLGGTYDPQWLGTQVAAVSTTPQVLLDHQVLVRAGQLLLQWDARHPQLDAAETARNFRQYVARVRALLRPAAVTEPAGPAATADGFEMADAVLDLAGPAPGSQQQTLFLLHPSGGDVLCYSELADRLHEMHAGLAVRALTDPELVGGEVHDTLPALADQHMAAIRGLQPQGPYLLGGWSMGGALAQQVAVRLQQAGEQVSALVMLDAHCPDHLVAQTGVDGDQARVEAAIRYAASLAGFLDIDLGVRTDDETAELRSLPVPELERVLTDRLRRARVLGAGAKVEPRVTTFARHLRILAAHRPAALLEPVPTLLVVADHTSPYNSGIGMGVDDVPSAEADLGWRPHLGEPAIVRRLDVDHYRLPHRAAVLAPMIHDLLAVPALH